MGRLRRAWIAVRALSWRERSTLVRAWLLLFLVAAGLRLVGFRRVQLMLGLDSGGRDGLVAPSRAERLAGIVHGAANWLPVNVRCLTRAMVLAHLLRRSKLDAALRIGVGVSSGSLAAHAWVDHGGVPLERAPGVAGRYAALDEPPLVQSA